MDGVHGHLEEIDAVLTRFAEHWKIHRMAVVDRNLLRLGVYELMFLKEIPFPIIINEALEIVKEFSDQEGHPVRERHPGRGQQGVPPRRGRPQGPAPREPAPAGATEP